MLKTYQSENGRTSGIHRKYEQVAIITSGYLPVPPTKGGAVENIIYNLIRENERFHACDFTVYSIADQNDETFRHTRICQIRTGILTRMLDRMLYFIAKQVFRREHLISYRYFFQRMAFMRKVGKELQAHSYGRVVLENNIIMFRALEYRDNFEKYRGKIYYHAHNELGKTLGYEKYLRQAKKIIGVSDYITRCFQKLTGAQTTEYETVHNAIDEKLFEKRISQAERDALKEKLGIDSRYPILLFAGRMIKEKGILELLEALYGLEEECFTLLVAGNTFFNVDVKDSFGEQLKQLAKKIRGKIIFTGLIPYPEMYQYYQLADICILPSVWQEPCGMTMIECIVSGTPLITTRTGGIPENATEATILLETNNLEEALREQLHKYLSDPQELRKLKEKTAKCTYRHGTIAQYYHNFIRALDIEDRQGESL